MPTTGYRSRPIRGLGSFVLMNVPAGSLGADLPESLWEWLPVAQVTDAMEIRLTSNEIDVSSPWDEWSRFTLGRKNVEALLVPVLYNPSLMAHSFVHDNGAPRKFLDRSFETWRIWTQNNADEGSACIEFSAAISRIGLTIPHQDLQRSVFNFRVNGPDTIPSALGLERYTWSQGQELGYRRVSNDYATA